MITIYQHVLDSIIVHAQKDAPIEACGYLAQKDSVVCLAIPLTNTDAAAEHFSLDPKEQFEAIRKIRADGMKLVAVYHSHPVTPARPSQEDIKLAYDPAISYVIVSLKDELPVVKSFRIQKGNVENEVIDIREYLEEKK